MGYYETQEQHNSQDSVDVTYWKNLKNALNQVVNNEKLIPDNIDIIKEHIKTLESAIKINSEK